MTNMKPKALYNLLGASWNNLHPQIQHRFLREPTLKQPTFYRGVMERVECSRAGKLFATLTRIIGNPLTAFRGENVPMDIALFKRTGLAGVYWQRTYYYEGLKPDVITSVKRIDAKGHLTECVGAGFGMELHVYEQNKSLHFKSLRYFWQLFGIRIPLPHILTPGETNVSHEHVSEGVFRFTLSMQHPILGQTFFQTGIFREI